MESINLKARYKALLEKEFDYAIEIGADFYSLLRGMYVGQLVFTRLYLPRKGDLGHFDEAVGKIKDVLRAKKELRKQIEEIVSASKEQKDDYMAIQVLTDELLDAPNIGIDNRMMKKLNKAVRKMNFKECTVWFH